MINIIAAIGQNRELGVKNNLIWHLPDDLKFFKKTTTNHIVVMGRKTFKSIGKPLPNRDNIIISHHNIENIETINNPEIILKKYKNSEEEIFIIGGATLYQYFIPYANKIYLTQIEDSYPKADTYFPPFNYENYEKIILKTNIDKKQNIKYKHILYKRWVNEKR